MNIGDVSEVVKTDYGYHIIKLNEIYPATLQSFEEVEGQLLALHKKNINQNVGLGLVLVSMSEEMHPAEFLRFQEKSIKIEIGSIVFPCRKF